MYNYHIAANRRVLNRLSYIRSRILRVYHIKVCISAPCLRPLINLNLFKDFVDFQSRRSLLLCRVLHTCSSTISMGKKGKNWSWGWSWEKSLKESQTNMAIFVWDSFQLLPQLAPDTRTLTWSLLKFTHNTKRSSDKQSESANVRPELV